MSIRRSKTISACTLKYYLLEIRAVFESIVAYVRYIRRKRYRRNIRIIFKHSVRNFRYGFSVIGCRYFNVAFFIIFTNVNRITAFVFDKLKILFDFNVLEYSYKRDGYNENNGGYRREECNLFLSLFLCRILFLLIFPIIYLIFSDGCVFIRTSFIVARGSDSTAEFGEL